VRAWRAGTRHAKPVIENRDLASASQDSDAACCDQFEQALPIGPAHTRDMIFGDRLLIHRQKRRAMPMRKPRCTISKSRHGYVITRWRRKKNPATKSLRVRNPHMDLVAGPFPSEAL
jgi:hypothetical protein